MSWASEPVCHYLTFLESGGEHCTVLSGQTDGLSGDVNTPSLKKKVRIRNNAPKPYSCHPGGWLPQMVLLFLGEGRDHTGDGSGWSREADGDGWSWGDKGLDWARNSEWYNRSQKEGGGRDKVVVEKEQRARSICGVEGDPHVTRSIAVPVKPKYLVTSGHPAQGKPMGPIRLTAMVRFVGYQRDFQQIDPWYHNIQMHIDPSGTRIPHRWWVERGGWMARERREWWGEKGDGGR